MVRTDNSFHLSYARGQIKTDTDKLFFEVAPGGVSGCGGFSGHPYSTTRTKNTNKKEHKQTYNQSTHTLLSQPKTVIENLLKEPDDK